KGLEPFDFERANLSGELWLAEGFTEYYAPLVMQRAQLEDLASTARTFGRQIETVSQRPGRLVRSAEEMSYMAPFADGGHTVDRTNWSNTFISYYTYGSAIALALDLTLRDARGSAICIWSRAAARVSPHSSPRRGPSTPRASIRTMSCSSSVAGESTATATSRSSCSGTSRATRYE